MLKSLSKGILIGIGFIIGLYILSVVPISIIEHPIRDFCASVGEMLIKIGK